MLSLQWPASHLAPCSHPPTSVTGQWPDSHSSDLPPIQVTAVLPPDGDKDMVQKETLCKVSYLRSRLYDAWAFILTVR